MRSKKERPSPKYRQPKTDNLGNYIVIQGEVNHEIFFGIHVGRPTTGRTSRQPFFPLVHVNLSGTLNYLSVWTNNTPCEIEFIEYLDVQNFVRPVFNVDALSNF